MDAIAGIVLFNTNVEFLQNNLNILKKWIKKIVLFDNTKYINAKNLYDEFKNDEQIIYISKNENMGIAYALNRIMEKAEEMNAKWCFTFDQDSKIPNNIYEDFKKYFDNDEIGIICPQVIDYRRKFMSIDKNNNVVQVKKCITSASCTRVDVWKNVGKYDEKLFIDLVDNDFSKRVYFNGYKIYKVNSVILDQEFGDIEYKDTFMSKIWIKLSKILKNDNLGKLSYKKNVNPLRIYYTNRNVIYLNEKLKQFGGIGYESYNCKNYFSFFVFFNFFSLVRGKDKLKIVNAIIKGVKDGKKLVKEISKK